VKETDNVRAGTLGHKGRLIRGATCRDILHGHQNFIYTGDVFLDFGDIMLEDGHLDALGTSQAFHNGTIFVSDVFFNDILECLYLVNSMI